MAGYSYGPPPPPPPSLSTSGGHAVYGHPNVSFSHHGPARGGGSSGGRGRGGHYAHGRGDYHASSAPQAHYEYAAQSYAPQNPAPYPASHHHAVTYSPHLQQWAHDHAHALSSPATHSHASTAIPPVKYHPKYLNQAYAPSSYSQQPSYGPPQQYGTPYQASPQPPLSSDWNHHGTSHQGSYAGNRGRGVYNDRAGSKPRHAGPIARQGYEHETGAPVGGTFAPPYPHDNRAPHYPPPKYPYAGPPHSAPVHQEGHHGQYYRRGRGGGHRDVARGRIGQNHNSYGGDRVRHHQRQNQTQTVDPKVKVESHSVGKTKKRKTNTLGLTPGMESEFEDDEGEEKALVELIGTETLEISDVAIFLAERLKNYPTKARVEARKAAELVRKDEDKAASLEKEADRLRKQLRKVESSIKRKREQGDEGDEMRKLSKKESSDDEKPEVMSSRPDDATGASFSLVNKADVSRHCKYYSTGGTCGKKGKCRFVHDPEVREVAIKEREANDGRMTIQQRLILNDKEQEDLTILQSIQYLRDKGLMKSVPKPQTGKDGAAEKRQKEIKKEKAERSSVSAPSLLPAAPDSLPEPPPKREANHGRRNPPPSIITTAQSIGSQALEHYQSWLLQPYGSTKGSDPVVDGTT